MTKKDFLSRLRSGLWFSLPKKRVNEIVAEYEQYFKQNIEEDETELVERCGDVKLIVREHIGGASASFISIRVLLLLAVSLFLYQYTFMIPLGYYISSDGITLLFNVLLSAVVGVLYAAVMIGPIFTLPKISRRIITLYSVNTAIAIILGIMSTVFTFVSISDVYIFLPDSIAPSEVGLVFFNILTVVCCLFILLTIISALYSQRIGFWAVPLIFINVTAITFYSSIADMLTSLNSPEELTANLWDNITQLTAEILIKAMVFTAISLTAYRLIRRRNEGAA